MPEAWTQGMLPIDNAAPYSTFVLSVIPLFGTGRPRQRAAGAIGTVRGDATLPVHSWNLEAYHCWSCYD